MPFRHLQLAITLHELGPGCAWVHASHVSVCIWTYDGTTVVPLSHISKQCQC